MVTEMVVVLPSVTLAGEMVHLALAGMPAQVRVAVPGTLAAELSSSGKTALVPLGTVTVVLPFGVRVKSTPVPLRGSVCGELRALSVTVRVPFLAPPVMARR